MNREQQIELTIHFFVLIPKGDLKHNLELRIDRFLMSEGRSESLDTAKYDQLFGNKRKADYLLADKQIVAELKTLTASPKTRIEQRLKRRLSEPGAPIVFGSIGMSNILDGMPDGEDFTRIMLDLAGRSVRRHLTKSATQIRNTQSILGQPNAAGLTILANDSEPMISLVDAAYAVKAAFEKNGAGFESIDFIWLLNENHFIRAPDGRLGFGQAMVSTSNRNVPHRGFIGHMIDAWAAFNGMEILFVPHHSKWESIEVVFEEGPPTLSGY